MKKLNLLPPPFIDYHDAIIKRRNNPRKSRIQTKRNHIKSAFYEYELRLSNETLPKIRARRLPQQIKKDLKYCYKMDRDILYSQIKENQQAELRTICQYCGIGESTELDHFVPQSDYPEFSLLILNLFLSCSHCNNKKLDKWKENGELIFIHLYHDQIENDQFLHCDVRERGGVFIPIFTLRNNGSIRVQLYRRIEEHFSKLQLNKRFAEVSDSTISEVRGNLMSYSIFNTRRKKRRYLNKQINTMKNIYGLNNWRTALYEGLAASNHFLDSVKSTHRIGSKAWLTEKLTGK